MTEPSDPKTPPSYDPPAHLGYTDEAKSPPPPAEPVAAQPQPPAVAFPGLKPGEMPAGPNGELSPEQMLRIHAQNPVWPTDKDVDRGLSVAAGAVFHQADKADKADKDKRRRLTVQFGTRTGEPDMKATADDEDIGPVGGIFGDQAKSVFDLAEHLEESSSNGDGGAGKVRIDLPGGRVAFVTDEELRERELAPARWAEEDRIRREKTGEPPDIWEAPAPGPRKLLRLIKGEGESHVCTTCKHSVYYVEAIQSESGNIHHHVRHFCSLLTEDNGDSLEFEGPVQFCSHHQYHWALMGQRAVVKARVWAGTLASKLASKLADKEGQPNG